MATASAAIPASSRLAWVLAILLGLAALIPFAVHTVIYLTYPFSLDETEGYVLGQVHRLSTGGRLYGPVQDWPWVVDNYPPAFPVLLNTLEGAVGRSWRQPPILPDPAASEDSERAIGVPAFTTTHNLPALRGVVALLGLGLAWGLWWSWGRMGLSAAWRIWPLLLFLAQPAVFFMFPLVRADWGALLCSLAALLCAQQALHNGQKPLTPLLLAALCGVSALLFRQSAVMALVAIGLTLLLQRDRRLIPYVLAVLGIGLALGVMLFAVYGAGIWDHLVTFTKTRWVLPRLWATWAFLWQYSALFVLLAGLAWWTCRQREGWSLPVVYAPLAAATALLSGKVGSDLNYFLEPLLGLAWVLGAGWVWWTKDSPVPPLLPWALCFVLLQSALLQNPRSGSYRPTRYDLANGAVLLQQLQQVQGPILSEEEGMVALAGHPVWLNPFITAELQRAGLWDDAPLVELITNRSIPVVILRELPNPSAIQGDRGAGAGWDRFSPATLQALAEHYVPLAVVPVRREWIVLVPRRSSSDTLQSPAR